MSIRLCIEEVSMLLTDHTLVAPTESFSLIHSFDVSMGKRMIISHQACSLVLITD